MAKEFEKMSKPELKAYADKKGIDISTAKLKEEIINILKEDEVNKGIEKAAKKAKSQSVLGVDVQEPGNVESIKEAIDVSVEAAQSDVIVKKDATTTVAHVKSNTETDMSIVDAFQARLKEKRAGK
jgi:hypothetical protein